nr:MAG TPA: hypothetical protein [Bacteriophage sp.]
MNGAFGYEPVNLYIPAVLTVFKSVPVANASLNINRGFSSPPTYKIE